MQYTKHYNLIMEKARARASSRAIAVELLDSVERHRIVPGCFGGRYVSENIAFLTPREHYVAHQLLVKMYPGNKNLLHAARMMCVASSNHRRTSREYDWLKKRFVEANKGNTYALGNKMTAEQIAKSVETKRATGAYDVSDESREKMSAAKKGKVLSEAHKLALREAAKKRAPRAPVSDETREKMRQSALGRKASDASKAKMSEQRKGKQTFLGHVHSVETRAKLKAAITGKKRSPETIARMKASAKARWQNQLGS